MYRGDDFGGSALQVGTFHRLADAIRRGCLVRPKKLKRCFRRGTDAADALGAAMATTEKANNKRYTRREIFELFPELVMPLCHPVNGRQAPLINIIVYLNDYSGWPREDIADWLCRMGDCNHEVKGGDLPLWKVVKGPDVFPEHRLNFHKMAEAMRKGCLLRPRKLRGEFKTGAKGACAVGAIAEGAGFTGMSIEWDKIVRKFPELHELIMHPLRGCVMAASNVIVSVNDETNYSREQIADWLCIESGCTHPVQTNGLNLPRAA
jgi:hypothetical protein